MTGDGEEMARVEMELPNAYAQAIEEHPLGNDEIVTILIEDWLETEDCDRRTRVMKQLGSFYEDIIRGEYNE